MRTGTKAPGCVRLSALYFSRALLECFAGTPLPQDLQGTLVADSDIQPGLPFLFNRLVNT